MSKYAWVTLTTNDTYSLGSLVLANSLKRVGTAHQLAVLVTPGVSESMRSKLRDAFNVVQEVDVLDSQDAANLALLSRPELGITFTKLHCWRLVQFEKCVFLDSDTIVLQNSDELFEREEFSAAPDVSWPDCFNSGVFVFKPSLDTFTKISEFAVQNGSFDGGDQGLLNSYFADWAHTDISKHLPFIYNVTAYASYCYLPAFKQFRDKIKILHFAGKMKPWLIQFNSETKTACTPTDYSHAADLIQLWWNIFCDDVHVKLTDNMKSYWLENLLWNNYQQQNCHNHMNQEYHNQQDHGNELEYHHHHLSQQQCDFDFDSVKEFRDPWADYYENLERQENEETIEDTKSNDGVAEQEEHVKCKTPEYDCYNSVEMLINSDNNSEITNYNNDVNTKNDDYDRHVEYQRNDETKQTEATISSNAVEDDDTKNAFLNSNNCQDEDLLDVNNTNCTNPLYSIDCNLNYKVHEQESHENEAGLAGALSQLRLGVQRTPEQEAYEQLMRRQCWESGQIDYSGKDSFDNIWKKITQTLESKPEETASPKEDDKSEILTSADIEDGKIEYDHATKASTQYKLIDGGYEMIITSPQPNGTVKTQVKTFFDPKPCSDADLKKEAANKKLVKSRLGKEVRIDKNTTMLTREIAGGYEEVYTVVNDDGSRSMRTKTFFDSAPQDELMDNVAKSVQQQQQQDQKNKKKTTIRRSSVESTDSTESRKTTQRQDKTSNYKNYFQENRSVTQNIEITEDNHTVRKNSLQQQNVKAISSGAHQDTKNKKKKSKSTIPPPPPDFIENDTTTVKSARVPGGVEYTYSTELESGKSITTTKTIYEEEETELTEEEIKQYKKTLKDAEKHKNVTTTKKLRSQFGTKNVVPSENPGDVTTVETIKIDGGTEYHYTTVSAEGIVKNAVKTIYDPVPTQATESDEEEEEIVEEYEEEIIEPGEKNIRTIETIKQLPSKFEEEVTITHEKREKKVKKSMMISH